MKDDIKPETIELNLTAFNVITYYEFKCKNCDKVLTLERKPTPDNYDTIQCPGCQTFYKINE